MEHPDKAPLRYSELKDPKLPEIRGRTETASGEAMVRPSPLPPMPKEL